MPLAADPGSHPAPDRSERRPSNRCLLAAVVTMVFAGCRSDEGIIICGERFEVDAKVVTFADKGGYDAYRETCWFDGDRVLPTKPSAGCDVPKRYGSRSTKGLEETVGARIDSLGWTLEDLRRRVRQFVLHFDVCVTSARCFEVLHDVRGLSVHFMLDVDGTLYQTLDLVERARHAGSANDVSIGIEIAHIGCYPPAKPDWRKYYAGEEDHLELAIPAALSPPPGGPFRPARPGLFRQRINGTEYEMPDYTEAQYRTLVALVDTLSEVFPELRRDVPRDAEGNLRLDALSTEELGSYSGILGHYHVTKGKSDPGPAMDWTRLVGRTVASP